MRSKGDISKVLQFFSFRNINQIRYIKRKNWNSLCTYHLFIFNAYFSIHQNNTHFIGSFYCWDNFQTFNNSNIEKHRWKIATRLHSRDLACTGSENLTGSHFVSPCDGGSPRREIELGAQQCPRKWTSERIKSPRRLSHGERQNSIIELANSARIRSRAKFAAWNGNIKGSDSFCELRLIRLIRGYECKC